MTNIDYLVIEGLDAPVRSFLNDVRHNPERASNNLINLGSVAAALYHVYANSKGKPDKLAAAIDSLPAAVMKGLAVAMSGHALKDLARGNYSYDPHQNPIYAKAPGMRPNTTNMNGYNNAQNATQHHSNTNANWSMQKITPQQRQFIQNITNNIGNNHGHR